MHKPNLDPRILGAREAFVEQADGSFELIFYLLLSKAALMGRNLRPDILDSAIKLFETRSSAKTMRFVIAQ